MGVALRNRTKVFLWCYIDLDEWGGVNSSWRQVRVQRSKLKELRRERERLFLMKGFVKGTGEGGSKERRT